MALVLHYHPLSSFCQKVLVALYELGTPFEARHLDLGDPVARAAFLEYWPTGKMPLLIDDGQVVPETSIIIEHLARRHAGVQTLLPADPQASLQARLWDRLFDLYVMLPMQAVVADRLRPEAERDPLSVAKARETLAMAYGLIDRQVAQHPWAAGDAFTIADCAAAPALFYAAAALPMPAEHRHLAAYVQRLLQRPSMARALAGARPYLGFFPLRDALPASFAAAAGA